MLSQFVNSYEVLNIFVNQNLELLQNLILGFSIASKCFQDATAGHGSAVSLPEKDWVFSCFQSLHFYAESEVVVRS
ncbi:MAG: hypothetical protein ACRC62_09565 [Microcoleus sp.]